MKIYNSFNEMFNAQSSTKSNLSVFNYNEVNVLNDNEANIMKTYSNFNEMFESNSNIVLKNRTVMNTIESSGRTYTVYLHKPRKSNWSEDLCGIDVKGYYKGSIMFPWYIDGVKVNMAFLQSFADRLNSIVNKYGLEFEAQREHTNGYRFPSLEYVTSPLELFGEKKGEEFVSKIAKKLAVAIEEELIKKQDTQKQAWNPEWDADFE